MWDVEVKRFSSLLWFYTWLLAALRYLLRIIKSSSNVESGTVFFLGGGGDKNWAKNPLF